MKTDKSTKDISYLFVVLFLLINAIVPMSYNLFFNKNLNVLPMISISLLNFVIGSLYYYFFNNKSFKPIKSDLGFRIIFFSTITTFFIGILVLIITLAFLNNSVI